jgi:hypothetical protein
LGLLALGVLVLGAGGGMLGVDVAFVVLVDFGVGVTVSGIFGGFTSVGGGTGVDAVGVLVVGVGVGVGVGAGVAAVAGVVGVVAGICATVTWRFTVLVGWVSAAYAAVAAPRARTAVAVMTVAVARQLGERVARLPGTPAPHCRHHSWPSSIEAPHLRHVGWAPTGAGDSDGASGDPEAGGSSGGAAGGESASNVDITDDSNPAGAHLGEGGPPGTISRPVGSSSSSSSSCQ